MILHTDKKLFTESIRYTAQEKGVKEIYIEKDYWICFILKKLFEAEDLQLGFKGGTALSKCYAYIERFSEDIDLALLVKPDQTANQHNKKLKEISRLVEQYLTEIEVSGITQKTGMRRKIAYEYPKSFKGDFGQVREQVIVEATYFGVFEPYEQREIKSYITEMMMKNNQLDLIQKFELEPFMLNVLSPIKTLCEKIMSLVRFSYGPNPVDDLNNKIRHIYDIYKLLGAEDINNFFYSDEFDVMLMNVAKEDIISFKNNNKWIELHPREALVFQDANVWNKLSETYKNSFSALVYGELPSESDMKKTLRKVSDRLDKIAWNIKILN